MRQLFHPRWLSPLGALREMSRLEKERDRIPGYLEWNKKYLSVLSTVIIYTSTLYLLAVLVIVLWPETGIS